jgi:hypothetical protein
MMMTTMMIKRMYFWVPGCNTLHVCRSQQKHSHKNPTCSVQNERGVCKDEKCLPAPTNDIECYFELLSLSVIGAWITWFCGPYGESGQNIRDENPFIAYYFLTPQYLLQTGELWQIAQRWRGRLYISLLPLISSFPFFSRALLERKTK